MAARKTRGTKELPESWKDKIKATQLMNRLHKCAMGDVEMDSNQIAAARTVLGKVIPDLSRAEQSVTMDASVEVTNVAPKEKEAIDKLMDGQL